MHYLVDLMVLEDSVHSVLIENIAVNPGYVGRLRLQISQHHRVWLGKVYRYDLVTMLSQLPDDVGPDEALFLQ